MNRREKKIRAKKRVAELKGFYSHATAYIVVNLFIMAATIFTLMGEGEGFMDSFFNMGNLIAPFFWGIGLAFHAAKVFGWNPFFTEEWEKRQIEKYMEEDRQEARKY